MATSWIENQPVVFADPQTCRHILEERRLINAGDVSQVQFKIEVCGDESGFGDDFVYSEDGDAWTITHTVGVYKSNTYKLTFDVVDLQGTMTVRFGTGDVFTITADGSYDLTGRTESGTGASFISIEATDGAPTVSAGSVGFIELKTNYIISIWNEDGYVTQINTTDNPTLFAFDKDTVTVFIDWTELGVEDYGCYHLCLHDPCLNTQGQNGLVNGDFTRTDGWTNTGSGWVISGGKATYTGDGSDHFLSDVELLEGVAYSVTYTIDSIGSISFRVRVGGTFGTTRTTAGTYTETIVCSSLNDFQLWVNAGDPAQTIVIDNVRLQVADGNDLVCDLTSNKFVLADHECTLVINGCNNDDGLGFKFESSGFSPMMRINASLMPPDNPYETERTIGEDSTSKLKNAYFKTRKKMILAVVAESIYVHDFLNALRGFDQFYIDGVEYFVTETEYPNIKWNKLRTLGRVDLEVTKRTQLIENINTGNGENSCVIGQNFWVDENNAFVVDNDNSKTIV